MEKKKRTRPSKSVTFTLNPKNPVEQALINVLEEKRSLRTSSHRYAYGTELIRELVLLGVETIEQKFPNQFTTNVFENNLGNNQLHGENMSSRRITGSSIDKSNSCDLAGTLPLE